MPVLETILGRLIEDRDVNRAGFAKTAEVAAFAYAAAMGNRMPLPVEVADDPLLERFMLLQPPDHVAEGRALVEWRRTIKSAGTAELVDVPRGIIWPRRANICQCYACILQLVEVCVRIVENARPHRVQCELREHDARAQGHR